MRWAHRYDRKGVCHPGSACMRGLASSDVRRTVVGLGHLAAQTAPNLLELKVGISDSTYQCVSGPALNFGLVYVQHPW